MVKRNTKGTGETSADVEREAPQKIDPNDLRSGSNVTFASEALLSYCERFERLTEEISALTDDRKEVMSEANAQGFDAKILRQAIMRRRMDTADRREHDAILQLYEDAIRDAEGRRFQRSVDDGE